MFQRAIPNSMAKYLLGSLLLIGFCIPVRAFGQELGAIPPQVDEIDRMIAQGWTDFELSPASEANDLVWARRVYLDIIGRIPSYDELAAFGKDRSGDKRRKLVHTLLHDDRYTEAYAENWASIWTNILIGRSGGNDRRDVTNRDGMQKYLRDSFAINKPYDRMVYELVSATGATKPGTEGFNGAVNFLAGKVNEEDGTLATSSTSRIFLGMQVQCTQCHNHPFNEWKQQKFWEFNAFFRQTRALRRFVENTRDIDHAELVDEDFAGEGGNPEKAMIFYELRNGLTKVAYPVFVDGTEVGKSGYVEDVNRREQLAQLMMQSEYLDKMLVNRTWAYFLGYGFTKPIDDLGPHNPSSNPELLEYLGAEVRKNSYDMKKLMEWICLSKPYQLSSRISSGNEGDDPSMGVAPRFSHFYLRQMSAEQLYQSMLTATGSSAKGSYEKQEQQRRRWLQQFVQAFGTDEGDESTTFNGSIPQALMMFNGELTKRATNTSEGSYISEVGQEERKAQDRLRRLFLTGLSRVPTSSEIRIARGLLKARKMNEAEMLQDMWWAILNSNEFILQH